MRLTKLKLKNFRGYREEADIDFSDLTAFVGRNDSGKSTILEALDIFFNVKKAVVKIDQDDVNVEQREKDNTIYITACFNDVPEKIVIDATNETSLQEEYLLNSDGELEICKKFTNGSGTPKIYIVANHPQNPECNDLLSLKAGDLKQKVKKLEIENVDCTRNAEMRRAIWNYYKDDLELGISNIDIAKEDAKKYWDKISTYLPVYSLFQADRKNSDNDSEVQDPLKNAVKEIVQSGELQEEFEDIAQKVLEQLKDVASRTLDKLKEMDPDTAKTLKPDIPSVQELKWTDIFKNVSITGDDGIPVNKRGSGVRRLILLNFFRAEVDRKFTEKKNKYHAGSIIYAIEEPETSQHYYNQLKLIEAFKQLSELDNVQVIITTHSGAIVKELDFKNLKLIQKDIERGTQVCDDVQPNCLPYPSLNEVNYVVFGAAPEEYHNELYGFIESKHKLNEFKSQSGTVWVDYTQEKQNGEKKETRKTLTEYIRHQIHHPENKNNDHYTSEQIIESIDAMRRYIKEHEEDLRDMN